MDILDKKAIHTLRILRRFGPIADAELEKLAKEKIDIYHPSILSVIEKYSNRINRGTSKSGEIILTGWEINREGLAFLEAYSKAEFRARTPIIVSIIATLISLAALVKAFLPEILALAQGK